MDVRHIISILLVLMAAITPASTQTTAALTTATTLTVRVTFRSVTNAFRSDLLDPTSTVYKERSALITRQLEPIFKENFPTYSSMRMRAFNNGSVINIIDLFFLNSFPNTTQVTNVLNEAASTVTGFDIETNSITVNGIGLQASSGVSHKISLITASFLVLLSWLLSSQH